MARADADRHLLFGLLALQTGLIDQGALFNAFNAWTRDKSRSLAEILQSQGAMTASRRSLLEALVAEHVETHGGDVAGSLAAVTAGPTTRESLIKVGDPDLDATLSMVGSGSTEEGSAEDTGAFDVGSSAANGQRYRVLRPHARGGLGAVFVALDSELNREVALKQILDRHADDPASRSRFVMEAEITGGLEHPGIVPVYGLGTFTNGRPFYAMRFIKGDSLKDAIARYHRQPLSPESAPATASKSGTRESPELELRKLLRRFLDVCNAIEYAHQRGILHRDLKPGNVMVGKYGETLVVDWGLAKVVGRVDPLTSEGERTLAPSSGSGSVETLPGSAIGTPAYMSPEQANGDLDRIGPRSDVYSLGGTLYCLLTGKPPYEADNARDVVLLVQAGTLTAPTRHNPAIDRALEAICLKAMAHSPENRYPSPRALAEDVDRWMAGDPVHAYPEPRSRRLARWARRHAPLVTGGVALLGAAVVGLAVITWLVSRQNSRLELARKEVESQSTRAKTGSAMARKAVKQMLRDVARDDLLNVPQAEPLRVMLAERALGFYREFVVLNPGETAFREEYARIEELVGSLYRMTGKYEQAQVEYEKAVEILQGVIADDSGALNARYFLATLEGQFGELIKARGGLDAESEPHYLKAIQLVSDLRLAHPETRKYASLLAATLNDLASMQAVGGRSAEAEPLARRAVAVALTYRATMPANPDPAQYDLDWIMVPLFQTTHGGILARLDRLKEAEPLLGQAIGTLRDLLIIYPDAIDPQFLLSDALKELGDVQARDPNRLGEALVTLDDAVGRITSLTGKLPLQANYPKYLVMLRADRGSIRVAAGKLVEAEEDLNFAEPRLAARAKDEPKNLEPLRELGKLKAAQSQLAERRGLRETARDLVAEAINYQRQALAIDPTSRVDLNWLGRHQAQQRQREKPLKNP